MFYPVGQRFRILVITLGVTERIAQHKVLALNPLQHFSIDKKAAVFQFDPVAGHAYDSLDKIGAVVFRKLEHHHVTLLGFAAPDTPFKRRKAEGERVPGIAVSIFGNEQKIADIKIRIH